MKQQKAKYVCNYALMSVTRSPRPPIAQKFQCFSLPEHNKRTESCHTNTCAHFHCLARDNEVLLLLHNCGLHCYYRRSFPVFAGSTVALHHFCSFPQTKNAFMTTLSLSPLLLHVVMDVFTPNSKMVMDQISSAKMRFWNDAEHWKQMCFHHKKEFFVQRQNKRLFRDLETRLVLTLEKS